MIDLHCHLLPAIDDGPGSLEEALQLARMAREDGITQAVLTPHIHPGRYDNTRAGIERAVGEFAAHLEAADIDIAVASGAEVRVDPVILPMIQAGEIPFIGRCQGEDILLLEFPPSHIPPGSDKLVAWLRKRGIRPLIAHPERNKEVLRNLDKIRPFIEMDCLLQVTAGAVAGLFGELVRACTVRMLERGWVSVLASDAHDVRNRVPAMTLGHSAAAEIVGEREAEHLVSGRPREWVADRRFTPAGAA